MGLHLICTCCLDTRCAIPTGNGTVVFDNVKRPQTLWQTLNCRKLPIEVSAWGPAARRGVCDTPSLAFITRIIWKSFILFRIRVYKIESDILAKPLTNRITYGYPRVTVITSLCGNLKADLVPVSNEPAKNKVYMIYFSNKAPSESSISTRIEKQTIGCLSEMLSGGYLLPVSGVRTYICVCRVGGGGGEKGGKNAQRFKNGLMSNRDMILLAHGIILYSSIPEGISILYPTLYTCSILRYTRSHISNRVQVAEIFSTVSSKRDYFHFETQNEYEPSDVECVR